MLQLLRCVAIIACRHFLAHRFLKAHQEQLGHIKKGCLARVRDDVASDGSRIEGAHKGWNGLQRSFSSGIETLTALCYDFVHRRNTRIESASASPSSFVASAYGSHHLRLVDACAKLWNTSISAQKNKGRSIPANVHTLPELVPVQSGETFGLMKMSTETAAYYSMVSIKTEELEDSELLDLSSQDILDASKILQEIGVDPSLIHLLPSEDTSKIDARQSRPLPPLAPDDGIRSSTPGSSYHDAKGKRVNRTTASLATTSEPVSSHQTMLHAETLTLYPVY